MPYDDQYLYRPLTEAEIAEDSLAGINAALEETYTEESYIGTNLSLITRAEDERQKKIENSLATLPQAIVEQIKRTQLELGSQVPCSAGYIYVAAMRLQAMDGTPLLRGVRVEPIAPGQMAVFFLAQDDHTTDLGAGVYDELFAAFFFDQLAIGTELTTRTTPSTPAEVSRTVSHSTSYTTMTYVYYTAVPDTIDAINIKVTAKPYTILDEEAIRGIFARRFDELYSGADYTPDAYILTSDILGALRVSTTTELNGTTYSDAAPITGAFVAVDPATITITMVSP